MYFIIMSGLLGVLRDSKYCAFMVCIVQHPISSQATIKFKNFIVRFGRTKGVLVEKLMKFPSRRNTYHGHKCSNLLKVSSFPTKLITIPDISAPDVIFVKSIKARTPLN